MAVPRQGEVWWANLPPPIGRRPVLILTRSDAIPRLSNVTIAPLTRTIRNIPTEVILSPEDGVPTLCAISLDNIVTVRKTSLDTRIVALDVSILHEVFEALRIAFAMPG
jgi:mRNA interferase MazF